MREAEFIKRNRDKWLAFEELMKQGVKAKPDELSDLFIRVTDDLAYARTYYPDTKTAIYLNSLAASLHMAIYRNKREEKGRVLGFWKYEVPIICYAARKQFLYAFLFFFFFAFIGALSAAYDHDFVRLVLGDAYVNQTISNIQSGKPMGIYSSMDQLDMFFQITFNNVRVSFMAFAMGIMFSVGTVLMLFYNGIMLGSFQYFFYEQGLLAHSASTIWIHGTLEISAIVIAGGAGLVMGNSILFPGTYPRMYSFKEGAKKGLKICLSLVPVFIAAGFLESFVTRYENMHIALKLLIIVPSFVFIIYYYFLYPAILHRKVNAG